MPRTHSRVWKLLALGGIVGHHGVELAAGIGLPGEPVLGRRLTGQAWTALLLGWFAADTRSRWRTAAAIANGAFQALALQHYLYWPWQLRWGIPILSNAEGLPDHRLPLYNAALLAITLGTTIDTLTGTRNSCRWHLVGLATLPAQYGSARHHARWLQLRDDEIDQALGDRRGAGITPKAATCARLPVSVRSGSLAEAAG